MAYFSRLLKLPSVGGNAVLPLSGRRMSFAPGAQTAALLCVVAASLLTGCATNFTMPDAASVDAGAASTFGAIQGSNFGGHAPIVGAHVFVLQAGTGGYNSASTSLLGANETGAADFYGNTFPTAKDTTPGSPTNGDYYVTTDAYGNFNVTGTGYTCAAGLPVYLYAQGGNPETNPSGGFTVNITSATGTVDTNNKTLITFATTGNQLLYQGETVIFGSGIPAPYDQFNGSTQVVSTLNLTTTTFAVELGSNVGAVAPSTFTSTVTQSMPIVSNPAIVNLAVLGICPNNGTANFNNLPFIYMNEVSTAAAAYALGGFFPAPGTSGLANAGAVAANLSIPASDPLALLGIQNAAITADQIYDIAGTNVGTGGDGETHIARTTTPGVAVYATTTSGSPTVSVATTIGLLTGVTITGAGIPAGATITAINTAVTPNTITLSANATATGSNVLLRAGAGSGVVPQTLLNTVANILANCVDSANTYNPYTATGTATNQCSSLFADALSAGTSGTSPVDTASAAIDIAHNPWSNVSALANLPTGNVPFQPYLNSAGGVAASTINDFSVGIRYTPTNVNNPEGLAIDKLGRIWYPNAGSAYVTTLSPFGAVQYNVNAGGSPDYIAIDGNGNAWFDNKGTSALQSISSTGGAAASYQTGSLVGNEGVSVDGVNDTGYIYAGFQASPGGFDRFNGVGALAPPTGGNPLTGSQSCMGLSTNAHSAVDNQSNGYHLWVTGESPDVVCIVNTTTGALIHTITINAATGIGNSYQPEFPAIDASGNAWIPNQNHASISRITQAGVLTNLPSAQLSGAFGAAVDGAGNIFVSNRTGNSITEFLGSTAAAVSTSYYGGGNSTLFSDPLNMQVDPSGNLWITNYAGSRIVELLGVAAPTWQPLSDAAYNNKLGSKP